MNALVIDSNVIISAIIKKGVTRDILTNLKTNFIFPEFGLEEIYSHKYEIIDKAKINEKEFYTLLLRLLKYIRLIPLNIIADFGHEAKIIMDKIDSNDTPFIATALALNCPIWSDDKHFLKQKKIKIFTTKDILKLYLK